MLTSPARAEPRESRRARVRRSPAARDRAPPPGASSSLATASASSDAGVASVTATCRSSRNSTCVTDRAANQLLDRVAHFRIRRAHRRASCRRPARIALIDRVTAPPALRFAVAIACCRASSLIGAQAGDSSTGRTCSATSRAGARRRRGERSVLPLLQSHREHILRDRRFLRIDGDDLLQSHPRRAGRRSPAAPGRSARRASAGRRSSGSARRVLTRVSVPPVDFRTSPTVTFRPSGSRAICARRRSTARAVAAATWSRLGSGDCAWSDRRDHRGRKCYPDCPDRFVAYRLIGPTVRQS